MISVEEFLHGRHLSDASSDDDGHAQADSQVGADIDGAVASGLQGGRAVAEGSFFPVGDHRSGARQTDQSRHDSGDKDHYAGTSDIGVSASDNGAGSKSASKSMRSKRPNRAHTHAVPVTSNYTSGFGGALDSEETFNGQRGRGKYDKYRRGRGKAHYRKYRTGMPVKRVPDDPADMDACREAALTLLDSAARSSGALVKRLIDKGYDPVVVQDVVNRLIDVHLIDDEEYARSVVRNCAARMLGFRGTIMELKRKEVDDRLAQRTAADAREQGVFEDAAWQLGRKTAARTEGMELQVRRRRFWSAGGRKGHDPETLRRVAHELFDGQDSV
ncbi:regulatory protein RecX [Bifidobacterium sp. ESL0745]|nr:regulatory protein RecX [Bifidobacterium sp. ESL0745]MDF7664788.1 regulatory protein RecX [Bifidobacterium sp. ESL0745]